MSSWLSSDETQELGGEVGDAVTDRVGESSLRSTLGGDRLSFKSSCGPLPFLRLMAVFCKQKGKKEEDSSGEKEEVIRIERGRGRKRRRRRRRGRSEFTLRLLEEEKGW